MFEIFSEALNDLEALKNKVVAAVQGATNTVVASATYEAADLAAAEKEAFTGIDATELTLSKAFELGAAWASSRVTTTVAAATTGAADAEPAAETTGEAAEPAAAETAAEPAAESTGTAETPAS